MMHPRLALGLAVGWAILLFAASSAPGAVLPEVGALQCDKLLHVALYTPLGALCLLALYASSPGRPRVVLVAFATAIAGLYGVTDEFHQSFVPGRSADAHDVLADCMGGLVGGIVAAIAVKLRESQRIPINRHKHS